MSKLIEKLSGSDAAKKALAKMIEAGAESVKDLSPEDIGGIGKTMDILMGHRDSHPAILLPDLPQQPLVIQRSAS